MPKSVIADGERKIVTDKAALFSFRQMSATEITDLEKKFNAYRKRMRKEVAEARLRSRDETALALVDIVDDCDRALAQLEPSRSGKQVADGLVSLRDRALRTFEGVGLVSFGAVGDIFDPLRYEALAVEEGSGKENSIVTVHRRGWMRAEDETIIRPASVTVLKGSFEELRPRPRRRRRRQVVSDYICPFGSPGCYGDCAGCAPPALKEAL